MAKALTKLYNTDREKLARKLKIHAERYEWDNIVKRYVNPFMEECEEELFPLYTSKGIKSWRQEA